MLFSLEEVQQLSPARMNRLDKMIRDRLDEWAQDAAPPATAASQADDLARMLLGIDDPVERQRRFAMSMLVLLGTPLPGASHDSAKAALSAVTESAPTPMPAERR